MPAVDAPGAGCSYLCQVCSKTTTGKAVDLLSGPSGLASFLRRRQLGARLGGPSLPLDIGYAETIPAGIRTPSPCVTSIAGGLQQARGRRLDWRSCHVVLS